MVADKTLLHRFVIEIVVWAVAVAVYAYVYVTSRIALPGAEGYERLWDWQLFFFAIGRLPGWIAHWREMNLDPQTKIGRPQQLYVGSPERELGR